MRRRMGEALKDVVAEGVEEDVEQARRREAESVLMNERRQQIFCYLCVKPCSHLRQISSDLEISVSTTRWHLDRLVSGGYVSQKKKRNRIHFYPSGMVTGESELTALVTLNDQDVGNVFLAILETNGMTQQEISSKLGITPAASRRALDELLELGLILKVKDGKWRRYFPTDRLQELATDARKGVKRFKKLLLKRLKKDLLSPRIELSRRRETEIVVDVGGRKGSIIIPPDPFAELLAGA